MKNTALRGSDVGLHRFFCTSAYICCCPFSSCICFRLLQSIILHSPWPHVIAIVRGSLRVVSLARVYLHASGGVMWLYRSTVEERDVVTQVLAVCKKEPGWKESLVEWLAKLGSSCAVFSSPVSLLVNLFAGMSELVSGDVHRRHLLVTYGFSYVEIRKVVLDYGLRSFRCEEFSGSCGQPHRSVAALHFS